MDNSSTNHFSPFKNFRYDFPSGIVVFLVALPLCLGVALASGAPLFSGIIAGFTGGIVIGLLSSSPVSVSGPAAGLTTIVLSAITTLGDFQAFTATVFMAGAIQFTLSILKAGSIGNYFPSSVIKGMLAAIGLILILKQIPHAVGFDTDFEGNESFFTPDGRNTFTQLAEAFNYIHPGAALICVLSLAILILWENPAIKKKVGTLIPAPLLVVLIGILLNEWFAVTGSTLTIESTHLVSLPVAGDVAAFLQQFTFPDFSVLLTADGWIIAFTIAIVASLESLLSIDAVEKLDPFKRTASRDRELLAQGAGNMVSGLIGGIPITAVIVRSSANVAAGARTKASALIHGLLLLLTVFFIPILLNKIPLASLAAVLLTVGYKLVKPELVVSMYRKGKDQFIPFITTIVAILFTDLLIGIFIGMLVGLWFVVKTNFHQALFSVNENHNYLIRLNKDVSFLNKALLRKNFEEIPDGSYVIIDGSRSSFIDQDILETINDFRESARSRNITVELKQSIKSNNPIFKA